RCIQASLGKRPGIALCYTSYTIDDRSSHINPDYVLEPICPEYIPLEDEHVFSAKEQPLPPVDSPLAESPGYVAELDPKVDPEEYEDDVSEDGLVDYHMDGGDDGDDDDDDLSKYDVDDKDEDEEEKEEHLASADVAVVVPTVEPISPLEGAKPVIPPPSTDNTLTGARIIVRLQACISFPLEEEVERLLAMPTPPPSPLTSLSPPFTGERLARIGSTQALIDVVTAALPLPPLPPPLCKPPPVDRRDDIPETELPPRKKSCLFALGPKDTWVDPPEGVPEIAPMTLGEVNTRVIELVELHKHDTWDLYALLEDARDTRTRISHRVTIDSQFIMSFRPTYERVYAHESQLHAHQTHLQLQEIIKKKMTDKYCPHGEIKKLEIELWNLKVKGNDVPKYTDRFQELTLICNKFFAIETKKIDKYISRLPDNIIVSMKASKPKTLDETIELANDLMNQKLRTYIERQTDNKRKADDSSKNNHIHQQHPSKRQNVAKVYNMGSGERKSYGGNLPKEIPKGNGCFECGAPGHFKKDYLKLKNKTKESVNARGWVYEVGNAEKKGNALRDPDSNRHGFLIDIVPTSLRNSYDVKLANGKIVGAQEYMVKGCQIFLAHTSAKKEEDKSQGKQLKVVPIVKDFPEVFLEDLPGLPPARLVEFQIELILGAAHVARVPYQLASSEMKELSEQLQELYDKGFIRPNSSPWGAS
nr:reverse transcriptase domain-containing protein [Tanacetum cinerariifolium]